MIPPFSFLALALWLGAGASLSLAQTAGSFVDVGETLVSAMMVLLGNDEKVYILDKVEENPTQIKGHPAYGSVWDIKTHKAIPMDVKTNAFCASGMHLPNGSWVTFGGNLAIGPFGDLKPGDPDPYQSASGGRGIRVLNPCTSSDDLNADKCQWFDDPTVLAMKRERWYSAAEPLADGSIAIIGGFVHGGYVNRLPAPQNFATQDGLAEPTFEFYPARDGDPAQMNFLLKTSGLNTYAHTFLMPSSKMFVQANTSTMLWDPNTNVETPLPDMPGGVVRVYPASGATAMLPLTPQNNYLPTILFCGGSDLPAAGYGGYGGPSANTWEHVASRDCQRITPEPTDGSSPTYVRDDEMIETRTMGQFVILPDGKMLLINGGTNGTAGYSNTTDQIKDVSQMPFGTSLASGPVLKPVIYDPNAAQGSRWSNAGLSESAIPRLYHSSAILLPDASVFVAGSNPNPKVNTAAKFPTTYKAEIFYPPYFAAKTRPAPSGIPKTISYGGDPFDITIPASSYSGSSNDAAGKTTVVVIRTGFTTHAMNMGQRYVQLNNTYTVNNDGSIVLHVAQAPPNPNLLQPGPAYIYVVMNGIPSIGSYVIVGNGQIGKQPTAAASSLPPSVLVASASGSADGSKPAPSQTTPAVTSNAKSNTGRLIGSIAGGVTVIAIGVIIISILIARRRRARARAPSALVRDDAPWSTAGAARYGGVESRSEASSVMPLYPYNSGDSTGSFNPYKDERPSSFGEFSTYSGSQAPPSPVREQVRERMRV